MAAGTEGGGIARVLANHARVMPKRGWQVDAISLNRGDFWRHWQETQGPSPTLDLSPPPTLAGGPAAKVVNLIKTLAYARRHHAALAGLASERIEAWRANGGEGPAVLQTVAPYLLPIVGQAGRRLGIASVWDMPNTVSDMTGLAINARFYRHICRKFDVLPLANSQHTAESFGIGSWRPAVVQPMTDEQHFVPARVADQREVVRKALSIPADADVLGLMSRLIEDKGPHLLIDAVASYNCKAARPLHVLLVGDGPADFLADLRRRATAAGAAGRVHLPGGRRRWSGTGRRVTSV